MNTQANYMLGQPGRVMAARPDLHDDAVIWVALYGSGWFKGIISNSTATTAVRAVAPNLYLRSGEESRLDGRGSIGSEGRKLVFAWSGP
jgi:hypothetical protein